MHKHGDNVFLIGLRYSHHAAHSGYEGFGRHVGNMKPPIVNFRWTLGKWGWALNRVITTLTRHRWYSLGSLLMELGTLVNMILHRQRLYHILYGDSDLWLLRFAHKITGHRLVASFHQPAEDLRALRVFERVARFLDGAILVSESQRSYFEEFLPPEKVFVVPHGVDSQFFQPSDDPKMDPPVCISLGSHLRDFDTFVAAVQLVWMSNPNVHFKLIGCVQEKDPTLQALEDPRVEFLKHISDDDLLWIMQAGRVGVFAFKAATANNALLEAMATSLPIVATDVSGSREYIPRDGGILVPQQDAQSMAAAILQIINDTDSATKMGRACRERTEQLDFSRVAERMCRVYDTVLHGEQAGVNRP